MADKNIQIKHKIGATWNNLFPKTKANLVTMANGDTLEIGLSKIVSSGTNSNGGWIKFDNGVMICFTDDFNGRHQITETDFVVSRSSEIYMAEIPITLPQPFIKPPVITGQIRRFGGATNTAQSWLGSNGISDGTNALTVFKIGAHATTIRVSYMAIGRWK